VAADGSHGYCKTEKKRWKKQRMSAKELAGMSPGPIRHPELPPFTLDLIRWSHSVVGKYLHPTLEKWELGFMRDTHVEQEVWLWHRIAFAYITYYSRLGRLPKDDAEAGRTVNLLAGISSGHEPRSEEERTLRECYVSPDGWAEEEARMLAMLNSRPERWTLPGHFPNWPSA
jgi:hypothetical protein